MESVSCIVPTETATCRIDYRNFHLQKWCQSEILLVMYNKEINQMRKHQVQGKTVKYYLYNVIEKLENVLCQ